MEFDWFVATIERPWYLGDLFHMDGWYLVGKKKGSISDGTIDGQVGQAEDKLLPMGPKAFVVIRNVTRPMSLRRNESTPSSRCIVLTSIRVDPNTPARREPGLTVRVCVSLVRSPG